MTEKQPSHSYRPKKAQAPEKTQKPEKNQDDLVATAILDLCVAAGASKSVCPTEVARAIGIARGEDDLAWRRWLQHVRNASVGLARAGRLVIYRKGKPADPENFRGVYRLGLPRSD